MCTEHDDDDTATTFTSTKALRRIGRQIVFSLRGRAPVFRPTSSQSVAPENNTVPLGRSYKREKRLALVWVKYDNFLYYYVSLWLLPKFETFYLHL